MSDNVNSPNWYKEQCALECIEAMEIAFGVRHMFYHCLITSFKYLWRHKAKNGKEDLDKAEWYLRRALMYMNATEICEEDKERYKAMKKILFDKYDNGYQE